MRLPVWLLLALLAPWVAVAQNVPYAVALKGAESLGFRDRVEEASRLIQLRGEPPASLLSLQRRAEADMERIMEVMRSEGYYGAKVGFETDEAAQPVNLTITLDPGPRFRLLAFNARMDAAAGTPEPKPVPLDQLGIAIGQPARAQSVVDAQAALLRVLAEQGYPLAKVQERDVVVDHAAATMRVDLVVSSGPLAKFGSVSVSGLERVDEGWVRRRQPWEPGERFSVTRMEELRKLLVESRLFSSVKLSTAEATEPDGSLPVTIELKESRHRSIGTGVSWSSSEGFGAEAYWEHRNLLGAAERLRTTLVASEIRNAADVALRVPDVLGVNQDVVSSFTAEEQRTDAYVTRTIGGAVGMEWKVTETWRASASTSLERTFEERAETRRAYTLVSFPLEARQDSTDDLLDPTRGNRLRAQIRPFVEQLGGTVGFTRFELYDSHYIEVLNQPRLILAGWGRIGTISGTGLDDVPADKRFYVGGGGSVRAYGCQQAGPVDDTGDPTGGLSALAFGGELRIKVSETVGVVPFIEAGNAYESRLPRPANGLLWGAGLGLRYHTPVGPVRADVAVPLNGRSGLDDAYQVYLSLGQAF